MTFAEVRRKLALSYRLPEEVRASFQIATAAEVEQMLYTIDQLTKRQKDKNFGYMFGFGTPQEARRQAGLSDHFGFRTIGKREFTPMDNLLLQQALAEEARAAMVKVLAEQGVHPDGDGVLSDSYSVHDEWYWAISKYAKRVAQSEQDAADIARAENEGMYAR